METTMPIISLGAAAFWIALAAVLIAGGWHKVRREQIKQETLLKLVEKTGQLDEAQVKLLFPPPPAPPPNWPPAWHKPHDPTANKRGLQGLGAVVVSLGAGIAVLATVITLFGDAAQKKGALVGFGMAGLIAMVGIGFFVASKFAVGQAPPDGR